MKIWDVVLVLIVLALVTVIGVGLYKSSRGSSTTTTADKQGAAGLEVSDPVRDARFNVKCNGSNPPSFSGWVLKPHNVTEVNVTGTAAGTKPCNCPNGDGSTQNLWHMVAIETWWEDLDPQKKPQQGRLNDLGVLACPCSCSCGQLAGKCQPGQVWCGKQEECIAAHDYDCNRCGCGVCR